MTKVLLQRVTWQAIYREFAYLYGSQIAKDEQCMTFKNPRIASGKRIVQFSSRTHYQFHRRVPELPLLISSETYVIERHIKVVPNNSIYIQLDFFNRQNEKIHFEIIRETTATFIYPPDAFHYTLTIISAGCREMTFYDISLYQEHE